MTQPLSEALRVMRQNGVPPECIGCLVMHQRAEVWLSMDYMDQEFGPDPDPRIAAVKPTAENHMKQYPNGCPGTTDGQCHSPMFTPGKP